MSTRFLGRMHMEDRGVIDSKDLGKGRHQKARTDQVAR